MSYHEPDREPTIDELLAMGLQAWGVSNLGPENPTMREWISAVESMRRTTGELVVLHRSEVPLDV